MEDVNISILLPDLIIPVKNINAIGTSPFWVMGILAILAFKKDRVGNMRKKYKLTIFTMLFVLLIISVWLMMFSILTHW